MTRDHVKTQSATPQHGRQTPPPSKHRTPGQPPSTSCRRPATACPRGAWGGRQPCPSVPHPELSSAGLFSPASLSPTEGQSGSTYPARAPVPYSPQKKVSFLHGLEDGLAQPKCVRGGARQVQGSVGLLCTKGGSALLQPGGQREPDFRVPGPRCSTSSCPET